MRRRRLAVAGLSVALCAGCSHAGGARPVTPPRPSRSAATGAPATTGATSVAGLVGIGALVATYQHLHGAHGGGGYGPAASYDDVRVVGFVRTFPTTNRPAVLAGLRQDLPADSRLEADFTSKGACEELWYSSRLLREVLDPTSYVVVTLSSPADVLVFDPARISQAAQDVSAAGPPSVLPCN